MTDQMRRACRSIPTNIAEGYRKRQYIKMFAAKIADADGESAEMLVWLDFARDREYIDLATHNSLVERYLTVGRMLAHPEKFVPRSTSDEH